MKYVKGICTISIDDEEEFVRSESTLYFSDPKDESADWREVLLTFQIPITYFTEDDETQSQLIKLKEQVLSFDIIQE